MKLRNKKTGEICELGHIRQAWREGKDGGMGYMLLKANDNNGIIYNSLAEMMDEWEDYKPTEPLIKDEKIRKAVRVWAEASGITKVLSYGDIFWLGFRSINTPSVWKFECNFIDASDFKKDKEYTIAELCGVEE